MKEEHKKVFEISGHRALLPVFDEKCNGVSGLSVPGKVPGNFNFRFFRALHTKSVWSLPFISNPGEVWVSMLSYGPITLYIEDGSVYDLETHHFATPLGLAFGDKFQALLILHESERKALGENFVDCLALAMMSAQDRLSGRKLSVTSAAQIIETNYQKEAIACGVDVVGLRAQDRSALKSYFKLLKEVWC